MERRYEGFLAPNGLIVLDTFTGAVKFVNIEEMKKDAFSFETPFIHKKENKSFENLLSDFDYEVCTTFPYPIAKPYFDLINEIDPRQKCKLLVDTFTAVLKLMALQIASEYIRAKEVKDVRVNQTLKRDIQRPLISAWNNVLLETIPVLLQNNVILFSPELVRAYESLETKCKNKVIVEKKYEDENGLLVTKRSSLAKIQSLIKYRNSLAHGFNQSKENAEKDLAFYLPILHEILENVRYMSRYTLWHVSTKNENVEGIRLMGNEPKSQSLNVDRSLLDPTISPLFLVNESTMEVLPMFSFLDIEISNSSNIADTGKDIFLFDGNTDNTIIYLSTSSGEHLEKKSKMKHWKELLKQKELELKLLSEKDLDLNQLRKTTSITTKNTIQTFIDNGKFIPEIVSKRDDLELYFEQFLFGNSTAIVIGGETGIGKSTLLTSKVIEWEKEGNPVLFYKASSLNSPEIGQKFVRDLGLKVNFPEDFFQKVDCLFKENNNFFFLVIDAINEYNSNVNLLINEIESLVQLAKGYRWFRFVISVRDSSYKRLNSKFGSLVPESYFSIEIKKGEDKNYTNVIPINRLDENLIAVTYEKYRAFLVKEDEDDSDEGYPIFKPKNAFKELDADGSTIQLLRYPLMMRLILQTFNRKELPSNLTIDEAMKIYINEVLIEVNNTLGSFPARKIFLSMLVKHFDSIKQDCASKEELIQNKLLRDSILNPQKDSAYVQLLDLGVLMEDWEEGECIIRFSYDRLFEYLLSEELFIKNSEPSAILKLIERSRSFKSLTGSIKLIFIRLVSEKNDDVILKVIDQLDDADEFIINLFVDFIKTVYLEVKSSFILLIEKFSEEPSVNDLKILAGVLRSDLILSSDETEFLLEQLISISEKLNNPFYKADAFCLYGNHLMDLNENKLALIELEKASEIYEENQFLEELPRIYYLIGRCQQHVSLISNEMDDEDNGIDIKDCEYGGIEKMILDYIPSNINWLKSYNKAIECAKQVENERAKKFVLYSLFNIAWGYSQVFEDAYYQYDGKNNLELSLKCFDKYVKDSYEEVIEIAKELKEIDTYCLALNNLANKEFDLFQFKTAKDRLQLALEKEDNINDFSVLGFLYSNLADNEYKLGLIDELEWFKNRIKAFDLFKKAGNIKGEINLYLSIISGLRPNISLFVKINEKDFEEVNGIFLSLYLDLLNRWTTKLKISSLKNNISKRDFYDFDTMIRLYCSCSFANAKQLLNCIIKIEDDFAFYLIGTQYFSNTLNLGLQEEFFKRLNTINYQTCLDLNLVEDESDYLNSMEEIKSILTEIELLKKDNWNELFQYTQIESSNDVNENYLKQCLKNLSCCTTEEELAEFKLRHEKNIEVNKQRFKKDKDDKFHFFFFAYSIIEKIVINKKITKKEILNCIDKIKLIDFEGFELPPYAFMYRLINYLNSQNEIELLKYIFDIKEIEYLFGPEDWNRYKDVQDIKEKLLIFKNEL